MGRGDIKTCPNNPAHIWIADIPYCPYCNRTARERVAAAKADRITEPELSRSGDPDTSRDGAEYIKVKLGEAMQFAYDQLRANPGSTASELDHGTGYTDGTVRKRLNDLHKVGLAFRSGKRRCGITGRMAYLWFPRTEADQGELFNADPPNTC